MRRSHVIISFKKKKNLKNWLNDLTGTWDEMRIGYDQPDRSLGWASALVQFLVPGIFTVVVTTAFVTRLQPTHLRQSAPSNIKTAHNSKINNAKLIQVLIQYARQAGRQTVRQGWP